MLETVGLSVDDALLAAWEQRVARARAALGWPDAALLARRHAAGAALALAAPLDQLLCATEVDEWSLLAALRALGRAADVPVFHAPGHPATWDEDSALHTLGAFAAAERDPARVALVAAAAARGLTVLIDEESLSIGVGGGSKTWPIDALPEAAEVDWSMLRDAPIALVTGSNGKTTTTRLIASCTRAQGWHTAYTCTDGVYVDNAARAVGDYSGPAGARVALRAADAELAVLETARGGILRRGLAVQHARVAVVTNISDDHFGEYGVHSLQDLADVKLTVARALGAGGLLVLNADDPVLSARAAGLTVAKAWFALDADVPPLGAHRAAGGLTCGLRAGHLWLEQGTSASDLGAVEAMPLSCAGSARYNLANLAAAALVAQALGVAVETIREVFARFGSARGDNPGRLQRWRIGGVSILVDYAHNPEGLRGLLEVAEGLCQGRLGLLLGQAGNREDAAIRELAALAASYRPQRIVLKDLGGYLRGRAPGEVPALLRAELAQRGLGPERVSERLDEYAAVRELLCWAQPGDVLALPVHGKPVRPRVGDLLQRMQDTGWRPGEPLPRG